ncbi:MAG: hypothetical protein R6V19_14680, partial [Armatimonadota bacterium]
AKGKDLWKRPGHDTVIRTRTDDRVRVVTIARRRGCRQPRREPPPSPSGPAATVVRRHCQ